MNGTPAILAHLGLTQERVRELAARCATVVHEPPELLRHLWSVKRHGAQPGRMARLAAGLTVAGTPRMRRQWPELAGLDRPTYHRLYMRTWRNMRRLR